MKQLIGKSQGRGLHYQQGFLLLEYSGKCSNLSFNFYGNSVDCLPLPYGENKEEYYEQRAGCVSKQYVD